MRISGGQWRGRRLKTPPGVATRPTSGKVKEALFNILGPVVSGARVADLFAGSGALGLEALSRGAAFCLFVEKNKSALKALEDNLATLAVGKQAQVLAVDAIRSQRLKERGPFSLILADPPYDQGLVKRVVETVARPEIIAPGGWLVVEHSPRERPAEAGQARLSDHRVYGQTELSFIQYPDMRKALT